MTFILSLTLVPLAVKQTVKENATIRRKSATKMHENDKADVINVSSIKKMLKPVTRLHSEIRIFVLIEYKKPIRFVFNLHRSVLTITKRRVKGLNHDRAAYLT